MSWIQTAYLIAEIIAIPLTGLFIRTLGLKRTFITALGVFTLASIACAASFDFTSLIAARVVQGFAGGVLIPLVFASIFLLFPRRNHPLATTIGGVVAVLAPTLGPIVGGWITETTSWHWLFLINVLPGIVAIAVAAASFAPEPRDISGLKKLDWLSLICLAGALAAFEIALKQAPDDGWTSGRVVGLLTGTVILAGFFLQRALSGNQAVVDVRLLARRNFAAGCLLSFALGISLFGMVYLMPVFLSFVRGHGPLRIGEIMLVTGAAQLLMVPVAVQLEKQIDARWLTILGFTLFALGLGLSTSETVDTDYNEMFWPQLIRGAAVMLCLLAPTHIALGGLSHDEIGDGSSLFNMMRNLGGAIGISLIDTVLFTQGPEHAEALTEKAQGRRSANPRSARTDPSRYRRRPRSHAASRPHARSREAIAGDGHQRCLDDAHGRHPYRARRPPVHAKARPAFRRSAATALMLHSSPSQKCDFAQSLAMLA